MNNILIAISGPTASGKTKLSIELAKKLNCEIISCDSRQFYKELIIGTAVPSKNQLLEVKHHLIHHISVNDLYTVKNFEEDALKILNNQFKKNKYAIVTGGSGFFLDSIIYGLNEMPSEDHKIRDSLNHGYNENGIKFLQNRLKEVDPKYYKKVDLNNHRRIIRALEVSIISGKPYSSFISNKRRRRKKNNFNLIHIGIDYERKKLYEKINLRVDQMITSGLIDEVRRLKEFKSLNPLNTVGYKEIINYLDDKSTLESAIQEIKKNTRRYAKRQLTWLRSKKNINWVKKEITAEELINQFNLK